MYVFLLKVCCCCCFVACLFHVWLLFVVCCLLFANVWSLCVVLCLVSLCVIIAFDYFRNAVFLFLIITTFVFFVFFPVKPTWCCLRSIGVTLTRSSSSPALTLELPCLFSELSRYRSRLFLSKLVPFIQLIFFFFFFFFSFPPCICPEQTL